MDRNLARKNVRSGLIVTAVCFFMFGMTFVAAAIYISMSPLDPEVPPAGEEIHLPGGSIQPLLLDRRHHRRARRRDDQHLRSSSPARSCRSP